MKYNQMIFPSKFSIFNKDLFVKISCLFEPASPATTQFFYFWYISYIRGTGVTAAPATEADEWLWLEEFSTCTQSCKYGSDSYVCANQTDSVLSS